MAVAIGRPWRTVAAPLAAGLLLAGCVLGFTAGFGGGLAVGMAVKPPPASPVAGPKKAGGVTGDKNQPIRTREQLRNLIQGRDRNFVLENLGKPTSTSGTGGNATWYYDGVCQDSVTGKVDSFVRVRFENDVVSAVVF
jgi:hypothetical protein